LGDLGRWVMFCIYISYAANTFQYFFHIFIYMQGGVGSDRGHCCKTSITKATGAASGKILLLVEMERIDWQTQQSTTGERGTDTHKKHDNKLLWLYHRHQYQHHYYIQQISIPGAWGILDLCNPPLPPPVPLIISFIFHGCILFTRLPKMHLKHHKEAGQHVVWYVGAWFGWKDNTYHPK